MPDAWSPDRRRADRRVLSFPLHARVQGEDEPMRVRELGPGGMVVESVRPLRVGDRLAFALAQGPDAIGPMQGHVVHSRLILAVRVGEAHACLTGVAFEHVTPDHATRIAWLLAQSDERRAGRSQDPS